MPYIHFTMGKEIALQTLQDFKNEHKVYSDYSFMSYSN